MDAAQAALTSAAIAGIVSLVTAFLTVGAAERRLRKEFQLQYAAERVVHELLKDARWTLRSFDVVRRHIGGFEDEELRRILVRAGAIRFEAKSGGRALGAAGSQPFGSRDGAPRRGARSGASARAGGAGLVQRAVPRPSSRRGEKPNFAWIGLGGPEKAQPSLRPGTE